MKFFSQFEAAFLSNKTKMSGNQCRFMLQFQSFLREAAVLAQVARRWGRIEDEIPNSSSQGASPIRVK